MDTHRDRPLEPAVVDDDVGGLPSDFSAALNDPRRC